MKYSDVPETSETHRVARRADAGEYMVPLKAALDLEWATRKMTALWRKQRKATKDAERSLAVALKELDGLRQQ
jgi:hypothetical protein